MKVRKVTFHNFGSFYGLHQVALSNRGLTFVLGSNLDEPKMESNGAGKSTLFDAMDWAFFGQVPKKDKTDSIVNEAAGSKCWVIVELDAGEDETWWVYRYRKMPEGHGVKLFCKKGETVTNCTTMDGKETDARIEAVLGMPRDVFLAAVYRQQGDTFNFAEATDSERKKMLTRLIPELAECDRLHEVAKKKHADAQKKHSDLIGQMQGVQHNLASFQQTDLGQMEQAWRQNRDQRLAQAQQVHNDRAAELNQAQLALQNLPQLQQQLQALQQPTPVTVWAEEYERRKAFFDEVEVGRKQADAERARIQGLIHKFQNLGQGECSQCGQHVSGQHLQNELTKLEDELTKLPVVDTSQAKAQLQEADTYRRQEKEANDAASQSFWQQHGQLTAEIQALQNINIPHMQQLADQAMAHVIGIHQEQWVAPDNGASIHQYQQQLQNLQKEADQQASVVAHWGWWVEALSNKGIKSYILDSRIEMMTEAANTWVQAMTGGTTWVRFETQTMTSSGKLSETFNVRIFRHNPDGTTTERNYRSWSGGEKKRVALGIDQGLSQLVASRAEKSWGCYIVDESFRQHMDAGGREAVFELLQGLDRDSIFVVDHDKEMAGQFERHLLVQVKDRKSSFPEEPTPEVEADPKNFLPVVG